MMTEILIEIDEELKISVEKILRDKYSLTLEQACILFFKECIYYKGIPF